MKRLTLLLLSVAMVLPLITGCEARTDESQKPMKEKLESFEQVELSTDLSWLSDNEREIIRLLFEAGRLMDDIFWIQAYGDKDELLASIDDEHVRQYVKIHYGPWDRLSGNEPFVKGFGEKPLGAISIPPT